MMNKSTRIIIVVLAAGLAASAIFNVVQYFQNHPMSFFPEPVSTPIFENRVLINGTITIDSDDEYYIEFYVPEGGPNVQVLNTEVSGNFTVSGNNTIRVYITNGSNFNPLSSDFSPYYDSGLTTSGNINLTLPSGGTYYLVYNNFNYLYNYTQSPEKIVNTQVSLSYTEI
jgi:hypothetical protein